ncbi:hypothetical protein [Bacillus sp. SA1-12]|uniref:hypothetical protein n=1 Tax=Bacillus sp. SA1-12 TaxID=1455638 RepID=UPI000696468B|nr:hypothetical protein [Bacillus sp. SA1-12]
MKIGFSFIDKSKDSLAHLLFDIENDPKQEIPLKNTEVESKMQQHMIRLMKDHDAPPEQYERLGLVMN